MAAVARHMQQPDGVRIRVLDESGGILVLTSGFGALLVDQPEVV